MTITLTPQKPTDTNNCCKLLLNSTTNPTIRETARVIAKVVASFPGAMHGRLYYRQLENNTSVALNRSKEDFDAHMCYKLSLV